MSTNSCGPRSWFHESTQAMALEKSLVVIAVTLVLGACSAFLDTTPVDITFRYATCPAWLASHSALVVYGGRHQILARTTSGWDASIRPPGCAGHFRVYVRGKPKYVVTFGPGKPLYTGPGGFENDIRTGGAYFRFEIGSGSPQIFDPCASLSASNGPHGGMPLPCLMP